MIACKLCSTFKNSIMHQPKIPLNISKAEYFLITLKEPIFLQALCIYCFNAARHNISYTSTISLSNMYSPLDLNEYKTITESEYIKYSLLE